MSLKVVNLVAENFKRLVAVEITPEGNIVEVAGNNGAGKSSVLDAIWVALKGRAANPPEPIRQGEEVAYIELDLGKYRITRRFTRQEDGDYTDFLRVEDPEGLQYPKPQQTLDRLLGAIGFDPFAFVQLKPEKQAAALLGLVKLEDEAGQPLDLAELASMDKRLYDTRREVNRDVKRLEGQLEGFQHTERVPVLDATQLRMRLSQAAQHNGDIERRKASRERFLEVLNDDRERLDGWREEIVKLTAQADELEADIAARQKQVDDAEELPEPIDTAAVAAQLEEADRATAINNAVDAREKVAAELEEYRTKSASYTTRLENNEKLRQGALERAKMPIEGLGVDGDDDGLHVIYQGVPFVQISTAEQLRVSTAIAMAGNPELHILRISDGSLLDDNSMSILREMAAEHDFQLFVELVRPNESTGIILEDGRIVGQELEPKDRSPKRKKVEPEGKKGDDPVTEDDARGPVDGLAGEGEAPRLELEPATYSWEDWNALPAARRAFLTKQGVTPPEAPATTDGDDDDAR